MNTRKQYIGDSVYAQFDGWNIILTTEDGRDVSNTIVLEPEIYHALLKYVEAIKKSNREEALRLEKENPLPK